MNAPLDPRCDPRVPADAVAEFRAVRDRGVEALRLGDLPLALELFTEAAGRARATGDQELVDLADCNRAAIQIELGDAAGVLGQMRDILLRSRDAQSSMVAATNAARIHDLSKDYKKGLFYARLAGDHAAVAGDASQLASIHNLKANLLLAESHVEEAAGEYQVALDLMPEEDPVWRARAIGNLGYCRILQQRLPEAFTLLHQSIEPLRRLGASLYLVSPLTDLAFAHLEAGHPTEARAAAEEALALAREFEDEMGIKNALYLAGEAAGLVGDQASARDAFFELQQRYYPDKPFVCDFLLSVDVRKIVNLRA